ncbi:MAG TPA: hypothetical protein VFQ06_07610 [Nitrospira sp.]|nr:hypothetical protein [Nitrospira sp.]
MKTFVALLTLASISTSALAASTEEGRITTLYTDNAGNIAVQLDTGFPNSTTECITYNGWAGIVAANANVAAALVSAKANNSTVLITISRCTHGGSWLSITGVYVKS